MSRLLMTAAVLAVLIYAMVLGVRWLTPRIEQDIADRVTTSLAQQGLLWADVEVKGREIVLTGEAPSTESRDRALAAASKVFGVAKVENQLTVSEEAAASKKKGKKGEPYALTITKDGDKVVLSGAVASEADKAVLMRLADTHYGIENVDAVSLTVVEGAPAGWRSAAGTVLYNIFNMENAVATLSDTEVMVSGTVVNQQFESQVEEALKATLPSDYKAAFAVEIEEPQVSETVAAVEPAAGATTDCADVKDIEKEKLLFGFDKARLEAEHAPVIERVAGKLEACSGEKVVLAGFTDKTGSSLYNTWLSQQRAEAAMRGLIRKGIADGRLKAVGYGEKHPAAANNTKEGRVANRRVEFYAGETLPYSDVEVVKTAPAKKVKKAKKAEIAKPWWANQQVSETSNPEAPKVEPKAEEKPWLGDSN